MKQASTILTALLASLSLAMAGEKPDLNADIDLDDPAKVEERINGLIARLSELRVKAPRLEVIDYKLLTVGGETNLSKLFGDKQKLLVIHNMGKECPFCTLWADGFNGILPHLEDAMAVVLVSTDTPEEQAAFAKGRGWRFRLASHKDLAYTAERTGNGMPGAAVYEKVGGKIFLKNQCLFDPGDIYCPMFPLLGLAGMENKEWQPKFKYGPDDKGEDKAPAE